MSFAARRRRSSSRQPPDPPAPGEPALPDPKGFPWDDSDDAALPPAVVEEPVAVAEPAEEVVEEPVVAAEEPAREVVEQPVAAEQPAREVVQGPVSAAEEPAREVVEQPEATIAEEPAAAMTRDDPVLETAPPAPEPPTESAKGPIEKAEELAEVEPWVGRRRKRTRKPKQSKSAVRKRVQKPVPPVPEIVIESIEVPVEKEAEEPPRSIAALEASEVIPVEPSGEPAAKIEPVRTPSHRARALLSIIGLALTAFGVGLVVFNNMVMPRLIHSVGEVRVPDLTNLTVEQAERALRPMNLVLSRAGERFDPSVPRGFILSQEPTPETPVRGNKRVTVVVSLGEEFSTVPELFGESLRSARYLLERAGLKVGAITHAPSEEVGEGMVAGSDPPAEALLARDTPVSLLVSSGAGAESYVMPDVTGREISGVRRRFESLGFRVFTPPSAPSIGGIVFQDPPPGSRITRGATILLQASGRTGR